MSGVVAYHLNPQLLPGGFLGVDVFFVISGYLIASIVLKQKAGGTFCYADFWARRIRRIIPALFFMVSASLVAGWLLLFPTHFQQLGRQAFGAITFHANHVALWLTNGYWGNTAESLPLLHTWSLGVEEQFYILFPLFIGLLLKLRRDRQTSLILCLVLLSFLGCVILTTLRPAHAFYWLPTRAWQIGVGVALAIIRKRETTGRNQGYLASLSALGIALAFVFLEGGADFPGWKAAIPTLLAALFIHGAQVGTFTTSALSFAPVVALGKASYSIYLWHWPIIVYFKKAANTADLQLHHLPIVLVLTSVASALSYLVIEKWGKTLKRPFLFVTLGVVVLTVASAWARYGQAGQIVIKDEFRAEWRGSLYDSFKGRRLDLGSRSEGVNMELPEAATDSPDGIGRRFQGGDKKALIIGDSHAVAAASTLERVLLGAGYSGAFMIADGLKPYPGARNWALSIEEANEFFEKQRSFARDEKPQLIVLVVRQDMPPPTSKAVLEHVRQLAGISKARVLVLGQPPILPIGDVSAPAWFSWHKDKFGDIPAMLEALDENQRIDIRNFEKLAREDNNSVLFETAKFCRDGRGVIFLQGDSGLNYIDDDHLSESGWKNLEKPLADFLEEKGL